MAEQPDESVQPLVDSGLRYCTVHHGVIDVDESDCDFRKCGPCDGDGVTRCESVALLYREASDV